MNLPRIQVPNLASERFRMGLDVVEVRRISESLDLFGSRFVERLFRDDEITYAFDADPEVTHQRLAARFAAKEAAIKAFDLGEAGVSWRDIEVQKLPNGACRLALHGYAAEHVDRLGHYDIALSLTHDGDYAAAVVAALDTSGSPASDSVFF